MPVITRFKWIAEQMALGKSAIITLSPAADDGRAKLRVRLFDDMSCSDVSKHLLHPMFTALEPFIRSSSVTDRGHKHSSGTTDVSFWLSAPLGRYHDVLKSGQSSVRPVPSTFEESQTAPMPEPRPVASRTSSSKDKSASAAEQSVWWQCPLCSYKILSSQTGRSQLKYRRNRQHSKNDKNKPKTVSDAPRRRIRGKQSVGNVSFSSATPLESQATTVLGNEVAMVDPYGGFSNLVQMRVQPEFVPTATRLASLHRVEELVDSATLSRIRAAQAKPPGKRTNRFMKTFSFSTAHTADPCSKCGGSGWTSKFQVCPKCV